MRFNYSKSLTISLTVILLLSANLGRSQNGIVNNKKTPLKEALPLDPTVRTGKLGNGFTYFIRHNSEPKNRVVFYLANKVGSILETDDQQGLAHFMEHMNFNGTKHFPKNQLVDYLQKAGVRFGADINAYTSFNETVYQLPLPADDKAIVKNGIEIMHDWAQGALLDPVEINKERGVVLEEKRLGKGASERMQRKYLPLLLNNSRYGLRLPIGKDTVLDNFKPETLQKFYHDWYRPDLQALIVVGDINVDEMEKTIRKKFADLKNPANEKKRIKYTIPLSGKNQFIAVTDKEASSTVIEVIVKSQQSTLKTAGDLRKYIVRELFNHMISDRYQRLSTQENPPFIRCTGGFSSLLGSLSTYGVNVVAKPNELEKGFKAAWRQSESVKRYGFTLTELERAKQKYLNTTELAVENKDKTNSEAYVNEYLSYFLHEEAAPGIGLEYKLVKEDLADITLKDITALIKTYIKTTDRDIIIMAPEKDKLSLPNKLVVEGWMKAVESEIIAPYQDDFVTKPLLSKQPIPGKIIKEKSLDSLKATEFTLSNGAKVILKKTAFRNNDINVRAFAPGGTSVYSDADYQSALNAAFLVTSSGMGPYNFEQLNKFLSDKRIGFFSSIGDYSQIISGFSNKKDLETLLQLFYLNFTQPKKDVTAFNNFITTSKARLANQGNNPSTVFGDTVAAVLGSYNVRKTGPSLAKIQEINLDRSYQIFKESFSDAANFTFTFIGDFDIDQVKPLIIKYVASLPSTYSNKQPRDLEIRPLAGKINKTVYKGIEPQASVRLSFTGNYNYTSRNNIAMDALAEVLQIRLIERLREDESGVYSPQVNVNYRKIPDQRYGLTISFGCSPQNTEKLIASTLAEVNKLKNSGPEEINIEKFKAENRRIHETQLKTDFFWSEYFTDQTLNHDDFNQVFDYDVNLSKVNKNSIKDVANKYLSGDNLIRIVLMPEVKNTQ